MRGGARSRPAVQGQRHGGDGRRKAKRESLKEVRRRCREGLQASPRLYGLRDRNAYRFSSLTAHEAMQEASSPPDPQS